MLGFSRWQLLKGLVAAVGIMSIVSLALIYFVPATPSKVMMATGPKGATFEYYGRQYRETFARSNVDLELRETAGAVENLELLLDPKSGVEIALLPLTRPSQSRNGLPSSVARLYDHIDGHDSACR